MDEKQIRLECLKLACGDVQKATEFAEFVLNKQAEQSQYCVDGDARIVGVAPPYNGPRKPLAAFDMLKEAAKELKSDENIMPAMRHDKMPHKPRRGELESLESYCPPNPDLPDGRWFYTRPPNGR